MSIYYHCPNADFELTLSSSIIFTNEDKSEENNVEISVSGYVFGSVPIIIRPLTYSEYQTITRQDLDQLFPRRPAEASGARYAILL